MSASQFIFARAVAEMSRVGNSPSALSLNQSANTTALRSPFLSLQLLAGGWVHFDPGLVLAGAPNLSRLSIEAFATRQGARVKRRLRRMVPRVAMRDARKSGRSSGNVQNTQPAQLLTSALRVYSRCVVLDTGRLFENCHCFRHCIVGREMIADTGAPKRSR